MTSLPTLPLEMLHRLFDVLDGTTILLSMRNVCQRFQTVVDTYNRYQLDLTSLSKPDSHRLLSIIRPEYVTGLSLSDGEMTPGQIGLFLSLIDIRHFTRLRSLTLLEIAEPHLHVFLRHAVTCSLTSFTLRPNVGRWREEQLILQYLSSIIVQPSLLRLELFDGNLSASIDRLKWAVNCKLRHLRLTSFRRRSVSRLLDRLPDLRTLGLDEDIPATQSSSFFYEPEECFSTPCSRLTSLTLSNMSQEVDTIPSALSHTPFLRHLKIISASYHRIDGSRWEEMIRTNLLFLSRFDFYTRFYRRRSNEETVECVLNELMTPFRTPFWTEEKRWLVVCNVFPTRDIVDVYTSPICISSYAYLSDLTMKTITNLEREDQHLTTVESVNELRIYLSQILANDRSLAELVMPVVDLYQVTKLTMILDHPIAPDRITYHRLIALLKQTSNLQSLIICWISNDNQRRFFAAEICSTIIPHANRSKLRHLGVPCFSLDEVKTILERFTDLFSIRLDLSCVSSTSAQIIEYVKTLMPDCSILEESKSVSIWMNERSKTNNDPKSFH